MTTRKVMSCSFEEGVVGNCNDFIARCFWNVKTRVRTRTLIKHCKKIWSKKRKKGRKKSDIPLKSSVQASSPLVCKKTHTRHLHSSAFHRMVTEWTRAAFVKCSIEHSLTRAERINFFRYFQLKNGENFSKVNKRWRKE